MGGEKMKIARWQNRWKGSPPHGRGKAIPQDPLPDQEGITPAWAGKRLLPGHVFHGEWDHPRVGGEKREEKQAGAEWEGSPPRGRGKGIEALRGRLRVGDHPRVGGEKPQGHLKSLRVKGSPPRGRGKGKLGKCFLGSCGITPAWAGKSPASQPWSPPLWMMVIRPRP